MQAYFNDQAIKDKLIAQLEAHYKADEIIKGTYWEHGKGSAVGCTIHSSEHAAYEKQLGVPRSIARLEDMIFERIANVDAKEFPLQFARAIQPGADLSTVTAKFLHRILSDPEHGVIRYATNITRPAIQVVIDLYSKQVSGETVSEAKWLTTRRAALDARGAYAAAAAAAYADYAAAAAAYARLSAYTWMRDVLLELLAAAPIPEATAA